MYDCCFAKENNWFRYRAGAFILHDNKLLFVKSNFGDYFYVIGGGVHLGETSMDCVTREVFEETGIRASVDHLAVVCENFFDGVGGIIDGKDCHTLEFYYLMKIDSEDTSTWKNVTDDGEELIWIPVDEIANSNIKPSFIPERIEEIMNSGCPLHIIENRDLVRSKFEQSS